MDAQVQGLILVPLSLIIQWRDPLPRLVVHGQFHIWR